MADPTKARLHDLAWTLIVEFSTWYGHMALKGDLPRAFTGVTESADQVVVILNDLPFDHNQRRRFLIWLCRQEGFVAYAYATMVGLQTENATEQTLDIFASSERYDATVTYSIEKINDQHRHLTPVANSLEPAGAGSGTPFHGLQQSDEQISSADETLFQGIWHELRPRCMWRNRRDGLN